MAICMGFSFFFHCCKQEDYFAFNPILMGSSPQVSSSTTVERMTRKNNVNLRRKEYLETISKPLQDLETCRALY